MKVSIVEQLSARIGSESPAIMKKLREYYMYLAPIFGSMFWYVLENPEKIEQFVPHKAVFWILLFTGSMAFAAAKGIFFDTKIAVKDSDKLQDKLAGILQEKLIKKNLSFIPEAYNDDKQYSDNVNTFVIYGVSVFKFNGSIPIMGIKPGTEEAKDIWICIPPNDFVKYNLGSNQ